MNIATSAYIAGFLDGDGSIIFQIVRRKDYVLGFQIRASVCFYQKSSSAEVLHWIKKRLGSGYIRERGEMSDYTIVGWGAVDRVLRSVAPYVVAKRRQVRAGFEILRVLKAPLTAEALMHAAALTDAFSRLNYSKRRTITSDKVWSHVNAIDWLNHSG